MNKSNENQDTGVKLIKFAALNLNKDFIVDDEKDTAQLQWSSRMGYPRITVFTTRNTHTDGKFNYNTMIKAPFDYVTIDILLQRFKSVLSSDDVVSYDIGCYNNTYVNNERTSSVDLAATVRIGRDDSGVVYISVLEKDKAKIKFSLLPSKTYFKFYDKNKEVITDKKVLSNLYANAYYKRLNFILNLNTNNDVNRDKMV